MKLVTDPGIVTVMLTALNKAMRDGAKAKYFILTEEEYALLLSSGSFESDFMRLYPSARYQDTFTTIDLTGADGRHRRFVSREKFHGVPLYVVPPEFSQDGR